MFFLNLLSSDFTGVWVLSDRQYSIDFKCPRNAGRGDEDATVWALPPFNLNGNDADGNPLNVLNIVFAVNDFKNWATIPITITGANQSAVLPQEIVASMQSVQLFNDFFTAHLGTYNNPQIPYQRVYINTKLPVTKMHFYVQIGNAETVLQFNKFAGVSQMPSYFDRHTIANRWNYIVTPLNPGQNQLINLSPGGTITTHVATSIINNALDAYGHSLGFNVIFGGTAPADYVLLGGRSGLFTFTKNTVDSSSRILTSIIYPAGAVAGDMAKLITNIYTSSETAPTQTTEEPYVLTSGDLIVP